ncbi:MAG: hypothetical protein KDA79_10485 [Planctomycetaceae bacterium]|nr:hypothetical protein [Planctomycetaceae bacterium]
MPDTVFRRISPRFQRILRTVPVLTGSLALLLCGSLLAAEDAAKAAQKPPAESDYYPIVSLPVPEGVVLESGALELLADGRLAVSTRRGEIWLVDQPLAEDASTATMKRFAHGLHEVLGLESRDGWLYATQRGELSRLKDTSGDGRADVFETVNAGWGITGDYHEYAFGSKADAEGNLWVTLCLTGSFSSQAPYRGWCVRITPEGKLIPTCSGLRSPGGVGANAAGDMFYTDNQGPWNGTCSLKWLRKGSFQGHPGGNRWYDLPAVTEAMGAAPVEPESGSRIMVEAKKIPEYEPPAILFPYKKMGQSASGIVCDTTEGKFGPFAGQMFVGDQTYSTIMRCSLEKVRGHYQGACYPFRSGFGSGVLALELSPEGTLFAGGTNRGWGSRGTKPFSLERMQWSGKVPFEILEMRARPDGFELEFTRPVDPETAARPESWQLGTYTYIYQSSYGSPEVDHTQPVIRQAQVAADGKTVTLTVEGLQEGHVHELHATGVRSAEGQPLLHTEAYYNLNYIPAAEQAAAE